MFDYTLDPTKPGLWCSWADQSSNEQISAASDEDGALIVPTAETVKQSFFLKIALELGIPLGNAYLYYFSMINIFFLYFPLLKNAYL